MDLPTAQQLMLVYERIGKDINEADTIIRTLSETERSQHLHALAGMVSYIWFNLQAPIVREHRELDPDKEYSQKK
ncbi:hypothetical protein IFU00_19385 [Oxalobacteraceae sp. CFBP 8761]|jgi:hypothetical protein|nr:hypothetical protein [Oxalobacteraceae sp. CFBP 8761]